MKRPWDTNKTSTRINIRSFATFLKVWRCELLRVLFLGLSIYALNGCVAGAYKALEKMPFMAEEHQTEHFRHLFVQKGLDRLDTPIIVFIDGDGRPWESRYRVAFDPTPDASLMLHWFEQSELPSIYLGRPCYFGLDDDACSAYWYTHGRYGEQVVESMVQVLDSLVNERPIILVGHSGGGTLAVLMAESLPNVIGVISVAGNLQVQNWAQHHQFSELLGSLDPEVIVPKNRQIPERHFYSEQDQQVRSEWILSYSESRPNAEAVLLDVPGHNIGWKGYWNRINQEIRTMIKGNRACCDGSQ